MVVLALGLSVGAFLTSAAFKWAGELPDLSSLDSLDITATSQVFARDGSLAGEILPVIGADDETTNRIPVGLDEVSPAVLQAIVAYEDDEYFDHFGIDLPGIARATYEEFLGNEGRGGSTITTQVIKNTLLREIANERSLERKVKEWMLAVQLERRLTKPEILQRYINVVFWGGQVYGIRAAADAYFGKDPIDLTLAEGLYLARLIPAPNARYSTSFEEMRASMRTVLDRMVAENMISKTAADRAWLEELQPRGWRVAYDSGGGVISAARTSDSAPVSQTTLNSNLDTYVTFAVRDWLLAEFGKELVFERGGLKVYTTIDPQAQIAAQDIVRDAEAPPDAQIALAAVKPDTGEILAMIGGRPIDGELPGEFNRALHAKRQPGSSFKPITYAAAIEQAGFTQATVLLDEKTRFPQPAGQPTYEPGNHDNTFSGAHTLRYHMDVSRNIPAILALEATTPEALAARATELGYENVKPLYSIALGSIEATPVQHAAAYTAFANDGVRMAPYFVSRVENANGDVIYEANERGTRVWTPQTAYIMLDLLYGNVNDGIGFSNRANDKLPGRWVGGKTGTTNDEKDIWFVGVTPGLVASVWIGYDDGSPVPTRMPADAITEESGTVTSSRQPVYIWRDFAEAALSGKSNLPDEFPVPDGIVMRNFNMNTGAPGGGTTGAFLATTQLRGGNVNTDLKIQVPIDTRTNTRATPSTPREFIQYREVDAANIGQYTN